MQGKILARPKGLVVSAVVAVLLAAGSPAPAPAMVVDDYAGYQPQRNCARADKPGAVALATWLTARGGGWGAIARPCGGGVSEHSEGRAFDWMLDAGDPAERALADATLAELFAPDADGDPHALAREMGIMYIIWNDRMYASYDHFVAKRYRSSSCRRLRTCSVTLRHRDHVHVSLSRRGGRARTSWYLTRPGG
ncbi:hypothetical protein [uncultured Nocardioides sp.]|uniref:hypothetical protein n=1 Tax=uncultured Nocardioides sp. TaxID=198441 RepID=UPI0025ED61CD|nr:hypothetical protein [uncultured Nocardioides sp.]